MPEKIIVKLKMDFLCTTYMFLFLYPSANIVSGIDQYMYYHQLRTVRVSNAEPTATSKGSLVQCAVHCSQNDDCWVAQWHADDELCEMFDYRLTISLVYPINTGNSTTTVLFGKPISGKNAFYDVLL